MPSPHLPFRTLRHLGTAPARWPDEDGTAVVGAADLALAGPAGVAALRGAGRPTLLATLGRLPTEAAVAALDALPCWPDGIVLGTCASGRDVQRLGAALAVREAERGLDAGSTPVLAIPDEAGLLAIGTMGRAGPRLRGLVFDAGALGRGTRDDDALLAQALGLLRLGAAASGLAALVLAPGGEVRLSPDA